MSRHYKPRHRHRRKITVPAGRAVVTGIATVAAAGTVGAASLATAPFAHAGPGHIWNRVAACESSGRWHISTGNGYYGGLQFSASTWAAYGGHRFGRQANRASRAEQIAIARRVLARQGPHAWPVCGPRAGLSRHSGAASTHARPGRLERVHAEHHRARHHHIRHHHVRHHHVRHHHVRHHHVRHHHIRVEHYVVRHGDTLSSIAARRHVRGGWRALWHHNRGRIHNPNRIHVGQVLRLP